MFDRGRHSARPEQRGAANSSGSERRGRSIPLDVRARQEAEASRAEGGQQAREQYQEPQESYYDTIQRRQREEQEQRREFEGRQGDQERRTMGVQRQLVPTPHNGELLGARIHLLTREQLEDCMSMGLLSHNEVIDVLYRQSLYRQWEEKYNR